MRAGVPKRGAIRLSRKCSVDPVSAILAFARSGEADWALPDGVRWFLYDFRDAAIISVPEWETENLKRCLRGVTLSGVIRAKLVSRYLEAFSDAGMSRELVEVVWVCYKVDSIDLNEILP